MKKHSFYKKLAIRLTALLAVCLIVSVGIAIKTGSFNQPAQQTAKGWGGVALSPFDVKLRQISPIPFANACGLGASSCFRCHNGRRAESPSDKPWHTDHEQVNFDCAGCHKGNPRIIKKSMAHRRLIDNPLSQPKESCSTCHAGDVKEKMQAYKGLLSQSDGKAPQTEDQPNGEDAS